MPASQSVITDTTRTDFEAGTLIDLDTASRPGAIRLALRPIPVAEAGPSQSVDESNPGILDGSQSISPSGSPLTYAWTQTAGPTVTLFQTDTAHPTFVSPDIQQNTTASFRLVVHDGLARSAPDTVTVTLVAANDPPIANAGSDRQAHEGAQVTLDGTGSSDANNDPLTYTWRQTAGTQAQLSDAHAARPTFQASNISRPEVLVFELVANDGKVDSAPDAVSVAVSVDNEAPVADAGPDQAVDAGSLVSLGGGGSQDPNGATLTYRWTQTSGTPVTILGADTASPILVAPYPAVDETLTFQLTEAWS